LFGAPIIGGPRTIAVTRDDTADGAVLHAAHDGYVADFGITHHRWLRVSADGRAIEGEDSFTFADAPPARNDEFAIRFHLHPAIKTNRLSDSHGAILLLPDRELWIFNTQGDTVEIEESVFLSAPDGPRRTVQIVIYGRVRERPTVRWSLRHTTPQAAPGPRKDHAEEPELPL